MNLKKINLFLLLLATWSILKGQESVNTIGRDASGTGGSVAYSIGQVVYTTISVSNGTVSQGVQQPYEIYIVGIMQTTDHNISLNVFPNPTADNLTIRITDYNNEKLSYRLYNMQGKLLTNGQIVEQQTQISMANLSTATYFIHVVNQENKKVQSFKIIKNQ